MVTCVFSELHVFQSGELSSWRHVLSHFCEKSSDLFEF